MPPSPPHPQTNADGLPLVVPPGPSLNLELMVHAVSDYLREHEGCQARHEWARSMHEVMWCLRTLRLILSLW